jgi:hypothetical protein
MSYIWINLIIFYLFVIISQPLTELPIMTVDSLKHILNEPPEIRKELESQRRKDLVNTFKTANFEDIVSKAAARVYIQYKSLINLYFKLFTFLFRVETYKTNYPKYSQRCLLHPLHRKWQIGTIIQQIQ